jgi:small nuclear ribonucleoprotein (snRNP)-like protein
MEQDKITMEKLILSALKEVKKVYPELVCPENYISQAALNAAIKQAILLVYLSKAAEIPQDTKEKLVCMYPIYVSIEVKKDKKISGTIAAFSKHCLLADLNWDELDIEEAEKHITITTSNNLPAFSYEKE